MESSIYLVTERKHDKVQEFLKLQLIQRKKRAVTLWKHYQTPEVASLPSLGVYLVYSFVMQFKIGVEVDDSVDAASWLKIDV
ncbi:hypothetical protein RHGRI_026993 [Rhododendron griersonianum]|uniref:Uncharacterized protein n=1 Tax=Rhododendron griersonianum TaxID=479676 RepID=A0AAV6IYH2_9ERIC|nr:hypothetical protein RHGRI_026993 [Rhododendron griersonianum]